MRFDGFPKDTGKVEENSVAEHVAETIVESYVNTSVAEEAVVIAADKTKDNDVAAVEGAYATVLS